MVRVPALLIAIGTSLTFGVPVSGHDARQEIVAAPEVIEIRLSDYRFVPNAIHLVRGRPTVLRLINEEGSHSFSAPTLFAASSIPPASGVHIREGKVEMDARETVEIQLTPNAPGTYALRCTHLLHSTFGMKGEAVVE